MKRRAPKRRPRLSKVDAQRAHSIRRAELRYDFGLHDVLSIENKIMRGEGQRVHKQSNRVTHYEVLHKGRVVRVVWDKQRKQAATFLPEGATA